MNPELPPLDPGLIEDLKYVLRSERYQPAEDSGQSNQEDYPVSPKYFERLLRESVQEALVRTFHPKAESNDGKEEMKGFVQKQWRESSRRRSLTRR